MQTILKKKNYSALYILFLSSFVVFFSYIWQGNKGFSLWDEGFLWYGIQRVLQGEVPIRDFMAYDPGRYYWVAVLVSVIGDSGIMSVRATVAVFQGLGLFVGLFVISRSRRRNGSCDMAFIFLIAITLAAWMFPRHKIFDLSISIMSIGVLTWLVIHPVAKRYFIAGAWIGLITVFGRNHGLYGALGGLGVIAWLSIKEQSNISLMKALVLWGGGVVIGFSPIIFMALIVPGFGFAFLESVRFLFEYKSTNLPLPIPWPWKVNFSIEPFGEALRGLLIGLFFLGTVIFAFVSIIWVVYRRFAGKSTPPVLVASAFLAAPYAHYAFSRADIGHLAHGVFPLLIGTFVLLSRLSERLKWPLALLLCMSSLWALHPLHPGVYCFVSKECVPVIISGSKLEVDLGTAQDISLLKKLADEFAPNSQSFIATPFLPGAYALLERRSPMWEIYALFPRSESFESREIERIKASDPRFVLVVDYALDGRDELRFKNTHPKTHQYIINNFDLIEIPSNSAYRIYRSRI